MTMTKQTISDGHREFAAKHGMNEQSLYQCLTGHCDMKSAEVRHLGQAAATRDEALDTANVFPIGTDHHAFFTTAYLSQLSALEEVGQELERSFRFVGFSNGQNRNPDVPAGLGNDIRDS
jgi:hypothetical protein